MLIAIFGTGRNGSTLLQRLLDGIPGVYNHPVEANFLSALNDLAKWHSVLPNTRRNATTKQLFFLNKSIKTSLLIKKYQFHWEDLRENYFRPIEEKDVGCLQDNNPLLKLKNKERYKPKKFIENFLKCMSDWLNKDKKINHYLFKTIETPYVANYETLFSDMKFIHLIRNPLDVYSSQKRTLLYKKCPFWYLGGDNLLTMINKRWIPHAKVIVDKKDSKNHCFIRYEGLIKNPKETIKTICNKFDLKLPVHPDRQTVLGGKLMKKLPSNASKKGIDTPQKVVSDMQKRFKYKDVLSPYERGLIIYLTYNLAKKLGYYKDIELPKKRNIIKQWLLPKKLEFLYSRNPVSFMVALVMSVKRRLDLLRI